MAKFDHDAYAVADSYARTLLELSEEAGSSDTMMAEFRAFVDLMEEDAQFGTFMTSPAVDDDARGEILEKHFRDRLSDLLLNTLQVINRKGRAGIIVLILERYRLELEKVRNEVDVHVTSAVELTVDLRERIRDAATAMTGQVALLVEKVNPDILGGLVMQIGDKKMDGSLVRRLSQIRRLLHKRATQEIHNGREYFEAASG